MNTQRTLDKTARSQFSQTVDMTFKGLLINFPLILLII